MFIKCYCVNCEFITCELHEIQCSFILFGEIHRIEHLKNCIKYNWEKKLFHYCSSEICVVFFPNYTVTNQSSYPNGSSKQEAANTYNFAA
jgi:hypothetical protein